ncbi:DUF4845 domain-containing protein [Leucothrix arctica]|uniref:DUF4845 domain-containing protein n=1 Tax=Leucothrix arctica TaxID=1481894 RepID=A0A317CKU2_9GAMM|nr:DUF4845 domain-containing protein [Leucothrix arctica]PWQ98959.1 hypothetical protein DKT75_02005 [Leucothrix arctica]
MKKSQHKQQGATLISWLIGISVGILIISAGLKVGPSYLEFNSVRSLMNNIAADAGSEKANRRELMAKVEKHLNINNLADLEKAYYSSKGSKDNPFQIVKLKKSNKRELTVEYEVKKTWLGNLSFLIDHKYAVELGSSGK